MSVLSLVVLDLPARETVDAFKKNKKPKIVFQRRVSRPFAICGVSTVNDNLTLIVEPADKSRIDAIKATIFGLVEKLPATNRRISGAGLAGNEMIWGYPFSTGAVLCGSLEKPQLVVFHVESLRGDEAVQILRGYVKEVLKKKGHTPIQEYSMDEIERGLSF